MRQFIQKAIRGPVGPYLEALGVLLLIVAAFYAAVFATGCYEPVITSTITSWESRRSANWRPDFQVRLRANAQQARPGERATRTLGGQGDPGTTQVSYRWTPPWGATNISFPAGSEPYPGSPPYDGPPYVWLDRDPTQEIHIEYNQPNLPPGESTMRATDTAVAEWSGHSSSTSYTTLITNEPAQLAAPPPLVAPARDRPSDVADLWEVKQWMDPRDITMTTDLCQDWFAFLQSDDTFLAMRVPVSPTAALTEGYPLPIVFGDPYSNTLRLYRYGPLGGSVITVPVELRPERHTFLESALPSVPGEHWMALGLVSDTVTCPPSLELPVDDWGFFLQGYLDLTHQPGNCEGCVLPFYYCYEGQDAPLAFTALRGALGGDVTSYQGWGITCIGPQAAPLLHESAWQFGGASSLWVTPTQPITLYHDIHLNLFSDPMTFTIDYTSTLGMGWHLYDDTGFWEPDPSKPITLPISVTPGDQKLFWMISDPVPTDTAAGLHTLLVTATSVVSPTDSRWASDAIWVGDWVAPPPGPGSPRRLYLPLVLRQSL